METTGCWPLPSYQNEGCIRRFLPGKAIRSQSHYGTGLTPKHPCAIRKAETLLSTRGRAGSYHPTLCDDVDHHVRHYKVKLDLVEELEKESLQNGNTFFFDFFIVISTESTAGKGTRQGISKRPHPHSD